MSKKVIPYGNRMLVRRRKIGDKLGSGLLVAADSTAERPTDLADVVYLPEHSFADKELVSQAENIVASLTKRAADGDSEALKALLEFNVFLKIKSLKVGDCVFISKYVGTDFHDNQSAGMLTLVNAEDIIGVIKDE